MKHGGNKKPFQVRPVPFKDGYGKVKMVIANSMTLEELFACGVRIKLAPKEQTLPVHVLRTNLDEYFGPNPLDSQIAVKPEN